MKDEDRNYEIVINSSINILRAFILATIFVSGIIIFFNRIYDLNRIWNICFLISMYVISFASFIELIICFWRAGKINNNIDRVSSRKSNLIFSSCITYLSFLGIFFVYITLSIILFS